MKFEFNMYENYGLDTKKCPYRVNVEIPSKTTPFSHQNVLKTSTGTLNIINHLTFFFKLRALFGTVEENAL